MSSINTHYTFNYSQPEDYRFSHDSVFLARAAYEHLRPETITGTHALDLCSGCGIIGLDFIFHARKESGAHPLSMDFLEVQSVYQSHFELNVERLGPTPTLIRFVNNNYSILNQREFTEKYHLILCNPPYFFPTKGVLSPSDFKNRCRFFIDSDFATLIRGIGNALAPSGAAYLLLRDLPEHRWNALTETSRLLQGPFRLDTLGDIRGTAFVKISKTT